jgi:hypothetical protein
MADEILRPYATSIYEAARYLPWAAQKSSAPWLRNYDPYLLSLRPSIILDTLSSLTKSEQDTSFAQSRSPTPPVPRQCTLNGLRDALAQAKEGTVTTCGGSFNLTELSHPLCIRYDNSVDAISIMNFDSYNPPMSQTSAVDELVTACEAATFGFQGKDVLDLKHRKALKLEPSKFSCNFHPADYGILDSINQLMLPLHPGGRNIRAELYKLNIYSQSGKFRSHIDTPRSETQFGSLVVCLPCPYEGGQLVVRRYSRIGVSRPFPKPQLMYKQVKVAKIPHTTGVGQGRLSNGLHSTQSASTRYSK